MQLGMVGLGRMGANMVRRLMAAGHECVVYDMNPEAGKQLESEGAKAASSLNQFVSLLTKPRASWVMVPAGAPTENSIHSLSTLMEQDDIIIDGGNSFYKDDVRRSKMLHEKGIHFVDAGTSGGIWGVDRGYCLMIGGEKDTVAHLGPIFKTLAPGIGDIPRTPGREKAQGTAEQGYLHCGPAGAGHFVKMVHNGIEYGIMQAYAEGFDIFRNAGSEALQEGYRYDRSTSFFCERPAPPLCLSCFFSLLSSVILSFCRPNRFTDYPTF